MSTFALLAVFGVIALLAGSLGVSTNAGAVADRWATGLANSTQKYKDKVNEVTDNPMQKAANAGAAYLAGCQAAESSGKRAAGLMRVSMADWKNACINKGASRLATGAAAAKPKFTTFLNQFLPFMDQAVNQLNQSNPRGSFDQNVARATAMMTYVHNNFKR